MIAIRVTPEVLARIDAEAKSRGKTRTELLLRPWMEEKEAREKGKERRQREDGKRRREAEKEGGVVVVCGGCGAIGGVHMRGCRGRPGSSSQRSLVSDISSSHCPPNPELASSQQPAASPRTRAKGKQSDIGLIKPLPIESPGDPEEYAVDIPGGLV